MKLLLFFKDSLSSKPSYVDFFLLIKKLQGAPLTKSCENVTRWIGSFDSPPPICLWCQTVESVVLMSMGDAWNMESYDFWWRNASRKRNNTLQQADEPLTFFVACPLNSFGRGSCSHQRYWSDQHHYQPCQSFRSNQWLTYALKSFIFWRHFFFTSYNIDMFGLVLVCFSIHLL